MTTTTPPAGFTDALAQLRRVQKTSKGAPAYSLLVNRRLGRLFAAAAYVTGRTPNQVTAVSAVFTFAGIVALATVDPTIGTSVLVAVLLAMGYGLDAADGQLARLRGGGSVAGEWLDHVVDAIKIATLHAAVLVGWFRFWVDDWRLLIPLAYSMVASVMFFVIILNDQLRRAHRGTTDMLLQGDGSSSTLHSLAVVPTDYGLLCWVFVLYSTRTAFAWAYGALMVANAAFAGLALVKWFREMRRYG